jgi:hypothetical protein
MGQTMVQAHILGKGYGTNYGDIEEYIGCMFLVAYWVHVVPLHCLSKIFIRSSFFIIIFDLGLQELMIYIN